jgi:hypothetical protein
MASWFVFCAFVLAVIIYASILVVGLVLHCPGLIAGVCVVLVTVWLMLMMRLTASSLVDILT